MSLSNTKRYDRDIINNIHKESFDTQKTIFDFPQISTSPIHINKVYFQKDKYQLVLSWQILIDESSSGMLMEYIIDAEFGTIIHEQILTLSCFDDNHSCNTEATGIHEYKKTELHIKNNTDRIELNNSYHVIPLPFHDPYESSRVYELRPWEDNLMASPNGWHTVNGNNYTTTHGNNVDAYEDSNNTNSPTDDDDARADGGENLNFDFPWTSTGTPSDYKLAAVTNLFYWNNIVHDVLSNYGFDEASGNFQVENYSGLGVGNDDVRAEAQDGNGTCNANFSTPPDGISYLQILFSASSISPGADIIFIKVPIFKSGNASAILNLP